MIEFIIKVHNNSYVEVSSNLFKATENFDLDRCIGFLRKYVHYKDSLEKIEHLMAGRRSLYITIAEPGEEIYKRSRDLPNVEVVRFSEPKLLKKFKNPAGDSLFGFGNVSKAYSSYANFARGLIVNNINKK